MYIVHFKKFRNSSDFCICFNFLEIEGRAFLCLSPSPRLYILCMYLLLPSFSCFPRVFFGGGSGGRFQNGVLKENTLMGPGDGRASNEARCGSTNLIKLWVPETVIYSFILYKFNINRNEDIKNAK